MQELVGWLKHANPNVAKDVSGQCTAHKHPPCWAGVCVWQMRFGHKLLFLQKMQHSATTPHTTPHYHTTTPHTTPHTQLNHYTTTPNSHQNTSMHVPKIWWDNDSILGTCGTMGSTKTIRKSKSGFWTGHNWCHGGKTLDTTLYYASSRWSLEHCNAQTKFHTPMVYPNVAKDVSG